MKKYRQLFSGQDTLRVGDQFSNRGADIQAETSWSTLNPCHVIAFMPGNIYRREVPAHNWISFKDREPSKEHASSNAGSVLVRAADGGIMFAPYELAKNYYSTRGVTHWMPLNFIEETRPVKVDGKELIPMKDGSVKISCGTTIPKEDVEEFLRQRNEVMK